MSNLTLIQLISAQAMQNLLPALALNASQTSEIYTPGFTSKLGLVTAACSAANHSLISTPVLLSTMPGIEETRASVAQLIADAKARGEMPVVNFTGATKLMSIGAWQAAKDGAVPSVYVDTQTGEFIDGGTCVGASIADHLPGRDVSFNTVAARLNVDVIAATNGVTRVTIGRDESPLAPLTAILLGDNQMEESSWNAMRERGGLVERALGSASYSARDVNQCLDMLETVVEGLPSAVAQAAVASGLLVETEKGLFLSESPDGRNLFDEGNFLLQNRLGKEDYRRRFAALREAVDFPINFLSGAWIEAAVADKMRTSGKFNDVRWSVNVGVQDGYDLEEDVVAVSGVQLAYVSCKRSDRLLAHAEEIDARARRVGGQFTSRYYIIHKMPYGQVLADLQQRCKQLNGIRLISTKELASGNPF